MELEVFEQKTRFESEVYIGDYTQYMKMHTDCSYDGVVIKNMPLPYTQPCSYTDAGCEL